MKKLRKGESGKSGEKDIVRLVPCPNCGKKLMILPANYPLYDVQCTGCLFRAQVKTNQCKPKAVLFGACWQIMNKVLKSGYMTPALFLNFKWTEKDKQRQEIRFYPFISKTSLMNYTANIKSRGRVYKMFNYNLRGMKYYVLFSK